MKVMRGSFQKHWASISLHEYYRRAQATAKRDEAVPTVLPAKTLRKEDFFQSVELPAEEKHDSCILHPESACKLCWDIAAMFLIFYQALVIPYLLCFEVDDLFVWNAIDLLITSFFCIDIAITFNTGYFHSGAYVASRSQIARHYLRCWFWVDFLTTFPYDLLVNGGDLEERSMSDAAKMLRILKFYRILRLVRLAKLKKILIEIEDYISNYTVVTLLVFLRLVVFAFFIAHWIACLWFYIGNLNRSSAPETWVNSVYMETHENYEVYVTALYWAFTTMTTVGYGEIHPKTEDESIFVLFAMAVSCAMFAYIVGSIGGLVSRSAAEQTAHREQVVAINSYMKQKKLPHVLRFRVRRYLDYIWEYQKKKVLGENEVLGLLSEPLREEIFVETRGQTINTCLIFQNFHKHFLLQLTKQLVPLTFAPGDHLFEEGECTTHIYFIQFGFVELYHQATECLYQELGVGDYFGEIAFFSSLPRTCSARCQEFVEVLVVARDQISGLLEKVPDAQRMFEYYQQQCHDGDLSALGVKCYFCETVGHVSANCPRSVIEVNNQRLKERWLAKKQETLSVNPYDRSPRLQRRPKRQDQRYNAANVVGEPRDPVALYGDNPALTYKITRFLEQDELNGSFSDSFNSSVNKTRIISNLDDFLEEESTPTHGIEERQQPCFDTRLLQRKGSDFSQ